MSLECQHREGDFPNAKCQLAANVCGDPVAVAEDACGACCASDQPRQVNHVVVSLGLRRVRERDGGPAYQSAFAQWQSSLRQIGDPPTDGGPGTELKKLLARIGIHPTPNCACNGRAAHMDRQGVAWCRDNVPLIVSWLAEEAKRRRLPFSKLAASQLVKLAIRRAERHEMDKPELPRTISDAELAETFQRVVCVNLDRRQDRWRDFLDRLPADWPFREVERYQAIDGKACRPPDWWKQGAGAWGCYRSHLRILEECLNNDIRSVLLLEDDALFLEGFTEHVRTFLSHVPSDWQMLYLGGQHLKIAQHPPKQINEHAFQPYNVNRTHAFAIQGDMIRFVYRHLNATKAWHNGHHVDHHLGRLHQRRAHRIYTPKEWLVGQASSKSNISGKTPPDRFWLPSHTAAVQSDNRFVAVIGLHRSGSSCLATVLHKLGVHMGNKLGGYEDSGGGEAVGLAQICERAARFPKARIKMPQAKLRRQLARWIRARQKEATQRGTIAGGKYPHLCAMGHYLKAICGEGLRVIHISRPLAESIESLKRRSSRSTGWLKVTDQQAEAVQRWLWDGKTEFLAGQHHVTVEYAELLRDPRAEVNRVIRFLGIEPTPEQVESAVTHVDAGQQHVGKEQAA